MVHQFIQSHPFIFFLSFFLSFFFPFQTSLPHFFHLPSSLHRHLLPSILSYLPPFFPLPPPLSSLSPSSLPLVLSLSFFFLLFLSFLLFLFICLVSSLFVFFLFVSSFLCCVTVIRYLELSMDLVFVFRLSSFQLQLSFPSSEAYMSCRSFSFIQHLKHFLHSRPIFSST